MLVVRIDNTRHIRHAAHHDVVPVKTFMELVVLRKALVEKVGKFIGYTFGWTFWLYGGGFTLKDHTEYFNNSPKCRLINPSRSIIGRVRKQILERINATTNERTQVHQWENTQNVIDWFKSLDDKSNCNFVQFDI